MDTKIQLRYVVILIPLLFASLYGYELWLRTQFLEQAKSTKYQAIIDGINLTIYRDVLHSIESGDIANVKEIISVMENGHVELLLQHLSSDLLDEETKDTLNKKLAYDPLQCNE